MSDLTEYARAGYDGNPNPHLYSSPAWYAHSCGAYLHDTGRPPPRGVRMGRGYSVRVGDLRYTHSDTKGWELAMNRQPTHEVVDTDTGKVVGTYISQITAYRAANRRNRNCGRSTPGTVRYIYRPIPAQGGAA